MSGINTKVARLRDDGPASIVVALVALPLCLGIALASGAPLFSGVIAGIIGGIVVGSLSGSPLGVSGPAAGLAVIVLTAIQDVGSYEGFLVAVVLAGLFQIALGLLKAGIIGYYFPSSVIKGMLSGIGIIIILKQIPHALGYDRDPEGDLAFAQPDGHNTFSELYYMLDAVSSGASAIAAISLLVLVLWQHPRIRDSRISTVIQGPLVVVILGIVANLAFQSTGWFVLEPEHLVQIPVAASIGEFIAQFTLPDFSYIGSVQIWTIAFTMAVVASLETLLCVEATDKLDPQKRVTPTNRELLAQGAGNILSGLIGGLPITQVIVRSSANIQSGGKTKLSTILHGVLLLICVLAIPGILNMVPLASLAAILIVVGYKLAKPDLFREMWLRGRSQFVPFVVTIAGIVLTDLLTGIGIGMVVAVGHILWHNYKSPFHFEPGEYVPGQHIHLRLSEDVSFLNKASLLHTLHGVPPGTHLVIDLLRTRRIDPDAVEIIDNFCATAEERGIRVEKLFPESPT